MAEFPSSSHDHGEAEEDAEFDANWSKKKQQIVRKLLEEFDMDKVREKYRCTNVIEYRVHPSEYSLDCALAVSLIRQRLLNLMGTDQVRINDREYIHKLIEKVEEEYEKEEEKKEKALQENEKKRLRRLLADGVITPEEINDMDSQKRENQRELRTPPPYEEDKDKLVTEKPKPFIYFDENNKKIEDEEEKKEEEEEEGEKEEGEEKEGEEEEGNEEGAETEETTEKEHKDDDVDPLILNLREGNTVEELYRRAEELLRGSSNAE